MGERIRGACLIITTRTTADISCQTTERDALPAARTNLSRTGEQLSARTIIGRSAWCWMGLASHLEPPACSQRQASLRSWLVQSYERSEETLRLLLKTEYTRRLQ